MFVAVSVSAWTPSAAPIAALIPQTMKARYLS
jgi:hypothetical protein